MDDFKKILLAADKKMDYITINDLLNLIAEYEAANVAEVVPTEPSETV